MKKTLTAVSAAALIGTASLAAAPTPASAHAWWVAPAIVGGVLLGGAAIASTAHANAYGYSPYAYYGPYAYSGGVYVEPSCRTVRQRVAGGWRHVRVCR